MKIASLRAKNVLRQHKTGYVCADGQLQPKASLHIDECTLAVTKAIHCEHMSQILIYNSEELLTTGMYNDSFS